MSNEQIVLNLDDAIATVALGERLGQIISSLAVGGLTLFLEGQLGAGKTTLTQGLLKAMGHSGSVKSPTYTLVEPYEHLLKPVYHFDLYRLGDPEELAYMGIRDYFGSEAVCIVEWPNRGGGFLPEPDIRLELTPDKNHNGVIGRKLRITLGGIFNDQDEDAFESLRVPC